MESNIKRITKNTFLLYIRSFVVLLISLYTSRVVLNVLGIIDYGIYSLVGGIVSVLSFMNSSLSNAYQRFFNYEKGKRNFDKLSELFKSSLFIQIILCLIVIIIAETIGLWFLDNKLIIPKERMIAANFVYQISVITFIITLIQAPFTSLIISNEKMSIFAIVSILDAILKLIIVLILPFVKVDSLILYGTLLAIVSIINFCIYVYVCKQKFKECVISFSLKKENFKILFFFGSWTMIDSLASVFKTQGINILLNMFFGPIVNSARGIASQVLHAVEVFVRNFQISFRPQITKLYAEGNLADMYRLYYSSTKISFFLLLILSLPIIIELPLILELWLGEKSVPEYTVSFTRVILLTALVSTYANPTSAVAHATGNIKKFNIHVSALNLLILPISYLFLKLGFPPLSAMLVSLVMSVFTQIVRLFIVRELLPFSIKNYCKEVVVPTVLVFMPSLLLPYFCKYIMPKTLIYSLFVCLISVISVCIFTWIVGLNKKEKQFLISLLKTLIKK